MSTKERLDTVTRLLQEVMIVERDRLTMTEIGLFTEAQRDVVLAGKHLGVEVQR